MVASNRTVLDPCDGRVNDVIGQGVFWFKRGRWLGLGRTGGWFPLRRDYFSGACTLVGLLFWCDSIVPSRSVIQVLFADGFGSKELCDVN